MIILVKHVHATDIIFRIGLPAFLYGYVSSFEPSLLFLSSSLNWLVYSRHCTDELLSIGDIESFLKMQIIGRKAAIRCVKVLYLIFRATARFLDKNHIHHTSFILFENVIRTVLIILVGAESFGSCLALAKCSARLSQRHVVIHEESICFVHLVVV